MVKMAGIRSPFFSAVLFFAIFQLQVTAHTGLPAGASLLWPPVESASFGDSLSSIDPCSFKLVDTSGPLSNLSVAIEIYRPLLLPKCHSPLVGKRLIVTELTITAVDPAIHPERPGTDESYALTVPTSGSASLTAQTYAGVLRGLETFSQLVSIKVSLSVPLSSLN